MTNNTDSHSNNLTPTSCHWGNYLVESCDNALVAIHPTEADQETSPIGQSLLDSQNPDVRVSQPMVRKSYLEKGKDSDGSLRGKEAFVPVSWETALDLAAKALRDTKENYGNEAIYGGSYGWASSGRFHHAQSQVHRFLRSCGGYVDCWDDYSCAAALVMVPHVFGRTFYELALEPPTMEEIADTSDCMVLFGGAALKNTQINPGGIGRHSALEKLEQLHAAGVDVYNISPVKDDTPESIHAEWLACVPNSDTAIMLGLAHTLAIEDLHDKNFLDKYCVGFEKFLPYLLGETDGIAKDADWAAQLSGIDADTIRQLARRMAAKPCVIGTSWSLQRQEYGEQSYWMAGVLAAMLGYIGMPGAGIVYGWGCLHNVGFSGRTTFPNFGVGCLPQGENPVDIAIPVARISDMLLNPGTPFTYNGRDLTYPDIKLVYWAGGNPFHHHQDINRLKQAWSKPDTVIVNESVWTATARHADIVFPATTSLERDDFAGGSYDCFLTPMPKATEPFAEARDDYDIFSGLAERLGILESFTEGKTSREWIEGLYQTTYENATAAGIDIPQFDEFWQGGPLDLSPQFGHRDWHLELFRQDPDNNPLTTPSGKIEIFSETVASFNYADCLGHPAWFEKEEWLGSKRAEQFPIHLVSNQPKKKLHSQLDFGRNSTNAKIKGREIVRIHPLDAKARNIRDGDIVRLFNERGSCLAAAQLTDNVRENVVELPTGSWYDPLDAKADGSLEIHGNPNVLTRDKGTSSLAQGPSAHSCLVEIEAYQGELPAIKAFQLPEIASA